MKTVLLTLCLLACAAAAAGDDKKKEAKPRPDLSGVWVLDLKQSKWEGELASRRPRIPVRLVIRHAEPEVRMTRTAFTDYGERTVELTYYADKRGEKNPAVPAVEDRLKLSGEVESEARWKDGRLLIRGTKNMRTMGDLNRIDFTETWELSADGKTLVQKTTHDAARDAYGATAERPRQGDYMFLMMADLKFVYTREQ
jgi:hypothetical protein